MPERLMLTGPPEQAAAQLIADLEQRGILGTSEDSSPETPLGRLARMRAAAGFNGVRIDCPFNHESDLLSRIAEKHHELQDSIVKNHELKKENEELKRMNEILKGQVDTLLKLNAESARPSASGVRRGRGRRGNMGTISEASPP